MVFSKAETAPPARGSFQEYQLLNQRMITAIGESTTYIKLNQDKDKEKVKARIERVDQHIKDHKEFLKERSAQVKKSAAEFEESANQFNALRRAYMSKRDAMANDAALTAIIEDGTKKRNSLLKSVKKIVQGKAAKKSWSPHVEHYKTDPKKEFGDAIDTLEKASKDLTKIEQELHTTKEDPKLLLAVIQEYHDLLHITDAVVDQTTPIVAARQAEWAKYAAAVDEELVEKKELKAHPTELYKSILAYKEVRAKVAPLVGAKKKGGCAVM